ncbi:MAG: AbrB/MazE/SpoVT family DNA-binding domain-containing protein [Thermoproteales archaeon]|nr:AbrB/MazE/SpoVT family DNA-binding domain-containing protein [Thermoproteales archaeon]
MKIAESRVSKRYLVSLPRAVRTALGLDVGDVIEWHVEDGKIVVKKSHGKGQADHRGRVRPS